MALVGVLVSVHPHDAEDVTTRLEAISGVSTFSVDVEGRVGVMIDAETIDAAHALLTRKVSPTTGVLTAWPVHVELEPDPQPAQSEEPSPIPS